jgi:NAD(P)-dependent dehydrogenase (short-subunit alcohol dehydrogenase family)
MTISGNLQGKRIFITGGSRGIGLAIALRAAADGASVAIAAKTADPNPKLPGTIFTAAKEIEAAGGVALPIQCDIRDEEQIAAAIEKTAAEFGGIDILINNASAICIKITIIITALVIMFSFGSGDSEWRCCQCWRWRSDPGKCDRGRYADRYAAFRQ